MTPYSPAQLASVVEKLSKMFEQRPDADLLIALACIQEVGKMGEEVATLKDKLENLGVNVSEWLCEKCKVIYPPQKDRFTFHPCPRCGTAMLPTSPRLRECIQLRAENARLREALEFIASKSTCNSWNPAPIGSGRESEWIGCPQHNNPDGDEWCYPCKARQALTPDTGSAHNSQ